MKDENNKPMNLRDIEYKMENERMEIIRKRKIENEQFKNKYFNKKMIFIYLAALIIISSFVKVNIPIPANVKVLLIEEDYQYISPPCLNSTDGAYVATEGTYRQAIELQYTPGSTCTYETVHPKQSVLQYYIMNKMLGIAENPLSRWNENGDWKW